MNFIDVASIHVKAGDGGNGIVSFRREKYVPLGGPNGGNGGKGGNIVIQADHQLGTLLDFTYKRIYEAKNGQAGGSSNCTGKSGDDVIIRVPTGTVVRNKETGEQLVDLEKDGTTYIVAYGGGGGKGNSEFTTATNQAPRNAEPGRPGGELDLELELKLLADVGLVGFPNVGKSTLIASISAAKPKIADYHFTTLVPNLGMVRAGESRSYTVADIPGLIEGAHLGKGLGIQFLRHIERTSVLLFMIDSQSPDPEGDLATLRKELKAYDPSLAKRESLVYLTRADVLTPEERKELAKRPIVKRKGAKIISAVSREGIDELIQRLWGYVEKARSENLA